MPGLESSDWTNYKMLNEVVPVEHSFVGSRLNEVDDRSVFNIRENINDGWSNIDFVVECRENGVLVDSINEVITFDGSGVELIREIATDNFQDVDVVTVEMFDRVHSKVMRRLYESMVAF